MPALTPNLRGALLSLAAFCAYACADVSIKYLGQHLHAFQIVFFCSVATLPCILTQIFLTDRRASLRPALPGWTAVRMLITVCNSAMVTYTFGHLPLAQCYAVFFTMPLMITLFAWPLLAEPIDPLRGMIVLFGFCGVLIALNPTQVTFQFAHLTAICGATLGALNSLILRKIGNRESSGVILLYPTLAQIAVMGVLLPAIWQPFTRTDLGIAALVGILSTIGGLCVIAAYRLAPAIVVAPMQYSQIIWASLLGVVIFHEVMERQTALGIAVIIAAGLTLLFQANRNPATKSAAETSNLP